MKSLNDFAERKLAALEERSWRRTLFATGRGASMRAEREGRPVVSFSDNDYLGLSQHPAVKAAAREALERYGTGAGASRLVTGNHPLYAALEERLARLKGTEAALVFGSGYLTNTGVIPALVGKDDLIVADELSHACLLAGARLAGSRVLTFPHNDALHLERLLATERRKHERALVLTEGVFSMDGDLAPLAQLADSCQAWDAWLLVDDAHGFGVLADGRGSVTAAGSPPVPLQVGTLSKAVGSYGGYLCASRSVVELLKSRGRTLVYSTGLPPATVAASLAALEVFENDAALCARPMGHARRFSAELGLDEPASPIVPVVLGDETRALEAMGALFAQGLLVVAIRPPSVPVGTARLRVTFSASHSDDDVERLALALRPWLEGRP